MRSHRFAGISIVAAVLLAPGAPVALGHTEVKSTSPARGTTAKTSIARATVTFDGPIRRGTLRVVGPGGHVASVGSGGRDPRRITRLLVGLKPSLRPGSYRASWTIVAADGHHQRGSFRFRLAR